MSSTIHDGVDAAVAVASAQSSLSISDDAAATVASSVDAAHIAAVPSSQVSSVTSVTPPLPTVVSGSPVPSLQVLTGSRQHRTTFKAVTSPQPPRTSASTPGHLRRVSALSNTPMSAPSYRSITQNNNNNGTPICSPASGSQSSNGGQSVTRARALSSPASPTSPPLSSSGSSSSVSSTSPSTPTPSFMPNSSSRSNNNGRASHHVRRESSPASQLPSSTIVTANNGHGSGSNGEYKEHKEHKRALSEPFASQLLVDGTPLVLTPVLPSQLVDASVVPYNPNDASVRTPSFAPSVIGRNSRPVYGPHLPSAGAHNLTLATNMAVGGSASAGSSPVTSPYTSPAGSPARSITTTRRLSITSVPASGTSWRCSLCLQVAQYRCVTCGPLLCDEHKKKHSKESSKHKFVTDLTPSVDQAQKCKAHQLRITSMCAIHGFRCKTCETTCQRCNLVALDAEHARLRTISTSLWNALNEVQRQREFFEDREESVRRHHQAQVDIVHSHFDRLRLALKDEENKVN
jgi:hypothetical protein